MFVVCTKINKNLIIDKNVGRDSVPVIFTICELIKINLEAGSVLRSSSKGCRMLRKNHKITPVKLQYFDWLKAIVWFTLKRRAASVTVTEKQTLTVSQAIKRDSICV